MKKLTYEQILSQRLTAEQSKSANRHPVSLMLHNVRSAYNVGSMFRTADSAMLKELILCGFTPSPPKKEIEKTALGAVDSVPWQYFKDTISAIEYSKTQNHKVFALELTDNARDYSLLKPSDFPMTIVAGNELTGIDDTILAHCDDSIYIPMYGIKHSLNVSVAVGISVFEAIRTWQQYNNT
jgi:23S rRNA (guanosine2251-2'-O)-methyltransferase